MNHDAYQQPGSTTKTALQQVLAEVSAREAEIIRRCAIPRWFDLDILAVLRERQDGNEQILGFLRTYSFVRQIDERHYAYHEDIRNILLDEWRALRPADLRRISLRLAEYFESLAKRETIEPSQDLAVVQKLIDRERSESEALYHRLVADPRTGEEQLQTKLAQVEESENQARTEAPKLGEPSAAWPICCSAWFGRVLLQVAPQRVFRWGIPRYR